MTPLHRRVLLLEQMVTKIIMAKYNHDEATFRLQAPEDESNFVFSTLNNTAKAEEVHVKKLVANNTREQLHALLYARFGDEVESENMQELIDELVERERQLEQRVMEARPAKQLATWSSYEGDEIAHAKASGYDKALDDWSTKLKGVFGK